MSAVRQIRTPGLAAVRVFLEGPARATWSAQGIPAPLQRRLILRFSTNASLASRSGYGTRVTLKPAFCSWDTIPVGPA
jgi:hypothetical protein